MHRFAALCLGFAAYGGIPLALAKGAMSLPRNRSLRDFADLSCAPSVVEEAGVWSRCVGAAPATLMQVGLLALRHWRSLKPLCEAREGSALADFVAARPECWSMVLAPYVVATWAAPLRFRRIVDHCSTVERLGPLMNFPQEAFVDLVSLEEIGPDYRLVLDHPRWLLRDGQMALSIWEGADRLFSLSFCLSSQDGALIAYVGGVQGRKEEGVLERYRRFTKLSEGVRPSDMIAELFRMLCVAMGVTRVLAVSDATRHQVSSYCQARPGANAAKFSYDEFWGARGAERTADGFFDVLLSPRRRSAEEVRVNKRAMYRRRYAAMDSIEARLIAVAASGLRPGMLGWHG